MSRTRFDTAIVGATLLTGDPARPAVRQGVLGIGENRIAFVGARAELPAEIPAVRVIEAEGRVITPGFINVHTHAVLSLMRGIALDMGFAPAYTRGVPHGHDITEDEAVALARLGALEALTFGSTTMVDSYVHAHVTLPVADLARDTGLNVWTHLSQSPLENEVVAKRSGCTPTQLLERVGLLNEKLIAAHCIYLTDDDIARIAASGMTVAHVPKGNATGGAMAPTPRLKQAGARIALGTDNLTQDMTEAMRWSLAVARIQLGSVSDAWQPRDALAMATSAGAQVLGRADEMGRLAPGYLADCVVFDFRHPHLTPLLDPLGTLVHDANGRDVEHVFIDGRQVIANGAPTLADAARIRADAQRAAEALWARAADESKPERNPN